MCPISGLVQLLIVLVTLLLICHSVVHSFELKFSPKNVSSLHMYDTIKIDYTITGPDIDQCTQWYSADPNIASIEPKTVYITAPNGSFNLTGNFLGITQVYCSKTPQNNNNKLDVTVVRKKRIIDTIFTSSVATLVSIIYINFGCALNWGEMLASLKRPIGPTIGFIGQFLIMPLLSFGLGKLLFPGNAAMQLGLFFTGVSPAGGASNIWTVVLDGNMDLSVTMTTISTLAAFGMMPLWLFTLGKLIFDDADIKVPYAHISTYAIALVIPLAIGYLISRYLKRVAHFLVRILKGFSALLLIFIVVFAIVTNLYLFRLFSWEIVVAGMGLPYLGYFFGFVMAKVMKRTPPDCLAIAIETGIQNTGIAIFLLRTLPQPQADLTTVVPVSVAMMTPFPLLLMYFYKKIMQRISPNHKKLSKAVALTDDENIGKSDNRLIPTIASVS